MTEASPSIDSGLSFRPRPKTIDFESVVADFPRSDHGANTFAPPPYSVNQRGTESIYAARYASIAWRKDIEDAAQLAGTPIHEARAHADDTCFMLAVLDKVWEV